MNGPQRCYVDPVLVAVSDCLVVTALERAWAKVVPRPYRPRLQPWERHTGYLRVPIFADRIDTALKDQWVLAPMHAARHELAVDVPAWVDLLDGYTRALLMFTEPHDLALLIPHLVPLAAPAPAQRPFVAVG